MQNFQYPLEENSYSSTIGIDPIQQILCWYKFIFQNTSFLHKMEPLQSEDGYQWMYLSHLQPSEAKGLPSTAPAPETNQYFVSRLTAATARVETTQMYVPPPYSHGTALDAQHI